MAFSPPSPETLPLFSAPAPAHPPEAPPEAPPEPPPGCSWDPWSLSWDRYYSLLRSYVAERRKIPAARESSLGMWVRTQRKAKKLGRMPPGRVADLEKVPGWSWTPYASAWDSLYTLLRAYVAEHQDYPHQARSVLGKWVNTQRTAKKRGTLTARRVRALENIPGWCWDLRAAAWDRSYALLCEYVAERGCVPPCRSSLGTWVYAQRTARRVGKMRPGRAAALEAVPGWQWLPGA